MSSGQSFYSTPSFELFRRGLIVQSVKKFRGMNTYESLTSLGPEWAVNCMNVMVPGWGGLSRFRYPVLKSINNISGSAAGPATFFDFQQANGTRQVVCSFANNSLWYLTNDMANKTLIESGATDAPIWSMVEANNIMFMANGQRMMKWTGTQFRKWGIAAPPAIVRGPSNLSAANPAAIGGNNLLSSITRAANVVTAVVGAGVGFVGGLDWVPAVGDTITIVNCPDATFNGDFTIVTSNAATRTFTWNQTAAGSTPAAGAIMVTYSLVAQTPIAAAGAVRASGVVTLTPAAPYQFTFGANSLGWQVGDTVAVSGVTDATFNGTFVITAINGVTGAITYLQNAQDSTSGNGLVSSTLNVINGYSFVYSFANSATGHVSNQSPILNLTSYLGNNRVFLFTFQQPVSIDPQVDSFYFFRTLDGGGDLFQDAFQGYGGTNIINDTLPDAKLNTTVQAPLINNPPAIGNFLAVGQSRVFVGNLVGATTDIIYSGYEQILLGRPEESFPPNNRIRLSIGASAISGLGILHHGIVAFSNLDRMYALRGQIEDISINAPVNFSAYLEELPYKIGCKSHATIQATPYGLLFWASDGTVCLFDFGIGLQDLSGAVYPILRSATPGQEFQAQSAYFNWLERDWYALLFAANGSVTNNYVLFFALNKQSSEIDAFPFNIIGFPIGSIGVITTSKLQKILCLGGLDAIYQLTVGQDTTGGMSDSTTTPPTANLLTPAAFWQSGYFGNDLPVRSRMWRKVTLVTQRQPVNGSQNFAVVPQIVDNVNFPVAAPQVLPSLAMGSPNGGTVGVNNRGTRMSVTINFPPDDASQNVLEMNISRIDTSDRG